MDYNYEGNIHKIAYFQIYCATDSCTSRQNDRSEGELQSSDVEQDE